ncbi:hypothetical protein ABPG72_017173 [Tetrahymena utriculariae]
MLIKFFCLVVLISLTNCFNYLEVQECQVKKCKDLRKLCFENRLCLFHWDKYNKLIFNKSTNLKIISDQNYKSLFQELVSCFNTECNAYIYYKQCGNKLRTIYQHIDQVKHQMAACLNNLITDYNNQQYFDSHYYSIYCLNKTIQYDPDINREISQSFQCEANIDRNE